MSLYKKALILGNYRPSYIFARTLVERGYEVACGLDGYDIGTEVSKYVTAIWDHPPLNEGTEKFQHALNEVCDKHPEIELIVPVAENFVRAFAEEKLVLPANTKLVSVDAALVNFCLDKPKLLTAAKELDIPVAPFEVTTSSDDLLEKAASIGFPLVVRPLASERRLAGKKAAICHSLDELAASYELWRRDNKELLIQKYVTGKRDNIYFSAVNGVIYKYLHAKIERTDNPDGSGLAVEGAVISPNLALKDEVNRLIKSLNYSGIGCAQFLVDEEMDQHYFLEINPRLAGNHAVAEKAGLDLGNDLLNASLGQMKSTETNENEKTFRYTWVAGEIESLRQRWRSGESTFSEFIRNLLIAFAASRRSDFDVSLNRDDWKPGFYSLCDTLPVIRSLSLKRLKPGIVQKLAIQKEWL